MNARRQPRYKMTYDKAYKIDYKQKQAQRDICELCNHKMHNTNTKHNNYCTKPATNFAKQACKNRYEEAYTNGLPIANCFECARFYKEA